MAISAPADKHRHLSPPPWRVTGCSARDRNESSIARRLPRPPGTAGPPTPAPALGRGTAAPAARRAGGAALHLAFIGKMGIKYQALKGEELAGSQTPLCYTWDRCAEEVEGQGELPSAGCCVPVSAGSQLVGHHKSAFPMERKQVSFGYHPGSSYTSPVRDLIQPSSHPSCHPGWPF